MLRRPLNVLTVASIMLSALWACFVWFLVYMAVWFFGHNVVAGTVPWVEHAAHLAVCLLASWCAVRAYRDAMGL